MYINVHIIEFSNQVLSKQITEINNYQNLHEDKTIARYRYWKSRYWLISYMCKSAIGLKEEYEKIRPMPVLSYLVFPRHQHLVRKLTFNLNQSECRLRID